MKRRNNNLEARIEKRLSERVQQHERMNEYNADVRVLKGLDQVKDFVRDVFSNG